MSFFRESNDVKVKLADFEGPLDLLLHLIREAKLDIKTVQLSLVTAQYLEYLSQLDRLNLNLASEFIEVGATLIDIKSRQILPKIVEEEEQEDPEARLRAQLEEYKLLKEASLKLREQENVDRFYKDPEPVKEIIKFTLDGINMDNLIEAFTKVMHRIQRETNVKVERQIQRDRFTVKDKMMAIRGMLQTRESVPYIELFASDYSKSEFINTFLAILELLKTGEVAATQENQFGDINIKRGESHGRSIRDDGTGFDYGEEFRTEVEGAIEFNIVEGIQD
ncbi:MAG: segregation/condensation protein A [Firmicutes bacterium]|nr:segregation/condensation protein A [Bacillota bacterium]